MKQFAKLKIPLFAACALFLGTEMVLADNVKPTTVPTMKSWVGAVSGSFTVTTSTKIIVRSGEMLNLATQLAYDVSAVTGIKPAVILSTSYQATTGDILLSVDPRLVVSGFEGYKILADSSLSIIGSTYSGAVFGTRSLLQVLALDPQKVNFPKGDALDYSDYRERGLVLDVGRKFFTKEFIKDYIRQLAYFKLNTFHIHLNDNKIGPSKLTDYSAFRLKSDNPAFSGLAATDGSYTFTDWKEIEDLAAIYGVTIIPEIDSPAHALAFTKFKPGINLAGRLDELDLKNPATIPFMKSVFAEFTPWFRSGIVHVGADEYPGDKADYTAYINTMNQYLAGLSKTTRVWGSLTHMGIPATSINRNVQFDAWNTGWYSVGKAVSDGFAAANTNDSILYVVPRATYYHPNGLDNSALYQSWTPEKVSTGTSTEDAPALSKNLLGAKMAVWNDVAADGVVYSEEDVHKIIQPSLGVLGEKIWSATLPPTTPYTSFFKTQRMLGTGPGLQLLSNAIPYVGKAGDFAFGKTTSASSTYPGFESGNAVDNVSTTRWASQSGNANDWLQVDLGTTTTIKKVALNWETAFAKDYDIQVSNNGTTWTTVYQRRGLAAPGVDTITLTTPASGRYVRMQGVTKGSSWPYSIFDFEIY